MKNCRNYEKHLEFGRSWIGKKFSYKEGDCVGWFDVIAVGMCFSSKFNVNTSDEEDKYIKNLSEDTLIVYLEVEDENGDEQFFIVTPHLMKHITDFKPKVVVNGYEADDIGDYYEFGCATI